jgi:hypothetical protein
VPRTLPTLGYPTLADAAEALRAEGFDLDAIAEKVGRSAVQVRASLCSRDFAKSPRTFVLPMEVFRGLSPAARSRGIDVPELVERLFTEIVKEDVVDALLGEPGDGA